jgi:hypothetical protein
MAFSSSQNLAATKSEPSETNKFRFQRLSRAIVTNQPREAALYIHAYPHLLLQTDGDKNTLLHLALAMQNTEIITTVIAALLEIGKLNEIVNAINSKNETILHKAILCRFKVLRSIVHLLGPAINTLARISDTEGKIPLTILVKDTTLSEAERDSNIDLILPASLYNPLIKLNQAVNVEDIIKVHGKTSPVTATDKKINNNLTIACDVINRTRKVITKSYTHPDLHELSQSESTNLITLINDDLRGFYLDKHSKVYKSFDKVFSQIEKIHAGNCDEMGWYCLHQLNQHYPDVKGELFLFNSHIFLVLDRKTNSDPNDPSTWGDSAVICDPWAGKAFPATPAKISEELHGWYAIRAKHHGETRDYNVLIKYNSNKPLHLLDDTTKKIKQVQPVIQDKKSDDSVQDKKSETLVQDKSSILQKFISFFGSPAPSVLKTDATYIEPPVVIEDYIPPNQRAPLVSGYRA